MSESTYRAIDAVTADFKQASEMDKRRQLKVPEWKDEEGGPMVIYVKPLSQADVMAIAEWSGGKNSQVFPAYVCYCALRADGKRWFGFGDIPVMSESGRATVVGRVARWMMEDEDVSSEMVEEYEKNS